MGLLFHQNRNLLLQHYEAPRNMKQQMLMTRSILSMDNFKLQVNSRLQFATMIAAFDLGPRLALWRWCTEGLYRGDHRSKTAFQPIGY